MSPFTRHDDSVQCWHGTWERGFAELFYVVTREKWCWGLELAVKSAAPSRWRPHAKGIGLQLSGSLESIGASGLSRHDGSFVCCALNPEECGF